MDIAETYSRKNKATKKNESLQIQVCASYVAIWEGDSVLQTLLSLNSHEAPAMSKWRLHQIPV